MSKEFLYVTQDNSITGKETLLGYNLTEKEKDKLVYSLGKDKDSANGRCNLSNRKRKKINTMKINGLALGMAQIFDDTISGMVKIFKAGSSLVNTTLLSEFGKEYKVASLLKELSNNKGEISEKTFDAIIDSTFGKIHPSVDTMYIKKLKKTLRKQFIK